MKVITGMDSFKGSLSSVGANQAVEKGIKQVFPESVVKSFAMADGGEGTVETLVDGMNGSLIEVSVTGPLGSSVDASYGLIKDENLAIIEVASACGLTLLSKDQLNPLITTTYGVGELINHAYYNGARKFIIGLGGSATNDGGVGMLQALGYEFRDSEGKEIHFGGGFLSQIHSIKQTAASRKFKDCEFRVACDVSNILYGEQGASYIFGPQKGANSEMLKVLDAGLVHYADLTQKEMNIDIANIEGGGAAGGLGAAFHGYLNGQLESGVELIMDVLGIEEELKTADLIITGEGQLDAQTSMGKVPAGLAALAEKYTIPIIAVGGSLTEDAYNLNHHGIDAVFSIQRSPISVEAAMEHERTRINIEKTVEQIMRVLNVKIY
ncbi:glycerate kinase [Jeotgalicoccus halotolerans]|uniref:Glycerate kinase n=1 Tax=Jeotgalicoccus nanhaiensis TaxID=568603 RepID=A0ABR9XXJ3_9STAP|nr:glycerate kinase [Jeotgalicoccus nanhaiensis]MBF0753602.1 glycerate kinase [Jeotgalicoccus nanhaiensis]TFU61769.1 glycerate kinase [Jeotgalicoccus nanhaiensis]